MRLAERQQRARMRTVVFWRWRRCGRDTHRGARRERGRVQECNRDPRGHEMLKTASGNHAEAQRDRAMQLVGEQRHAQAGTAACWRRW